ncbi:MAG TPA: hypothetical protein EYO82_01605 [Gammaproteobacteria bacterium]|nr:hypothetical protein [Gammaproteobacteria bacterium]
MELFESIWSSTETCWFIITLLVVAASDTNIDSSTETGDDDWITSVITIFSSTTIVIGCGVVRWDLLALDIGVGLKGGSCAAAKLENVKTSKVSTYSADRLLLKLKP